MKEMWRDISGFEGYYQVSNLGRIKSLDRVVKSGRNRWTRRDGKMIAIILDYKGYSRIRISKNNKVNNLEWVTNLENSKHFFQSKNAEERNKKISCENNPKAKLNWDEVNLIRKLKEEYNFTDYTLSWLFSIGKSQVNKIVNYQQWIKEV